MPTIVCFEEGIAKDKIIGFSELGDDDFKTIQLIRRLVKSGCIKPRNKFEKGFAMRCEYENDDSCEDDYWHKWINIYIYLIEFEKFK